MLELAAFESFVPLCVAGPDARTFVQGQVTNDVRKLSPERALFAGLCSAQGRVQAMLSLIERTEGFIAIVDAALGNQVATRLEAFTLSSKVVVSRPPLVIAPVSAARASELVECVPDAAGASATCGAVSVLRWWSAEPRYLAIAPRESVRLLASERESSALAWRRGDVLAGLPSIHLETQRSFVPQMINLDLVNGVNYEKGCYVGQEVVARAWRSGVPRRMFGFGSPSPPPTPGTAVMAGGAEVGQVVDAVTCETGCELLAVVDVEQLAAGLSLRGFADSALSLRSLPYAVPHERR